MGALVLLAEGFEEVEALTCVDVLRRAGVKTDICSIKDINVLGAHNMEIKSDVNIDQINNNNYNCIILPGGMPGSLNLKNDKKVIDLIRNFNKENKIIAAICAAPIVLAQADIIKNRNITSYPGFEEELKKGNYIDDEIVVQDKNIITSRGPATAVFFALKILENLKGAEAAAKIRKEMLVNMI